MAFNFPQLKLHQRQFVDSFFFFFQKPSDFDFESWRKRFMKWLKQRKMKPMEFFRAMDKDGDGTISRQEFMDGMLKSSKIWPISFRLIYLSCLQKNKY